ncbi:thermosome subunit, partial [Candidatus Woesearchaeota archaeon]|nr:thermosome subunit [Candidatus Woesearchaeota archaeon]
RGGTEHVVEEIKRALDDAIGDLAASLKLKKVVGGAGAAELEVARMVNKYASQFSGREQLAIRAFAETLEVIPKTLAENAGIDPIDVLTELKSHHNKGTKWAGINVFTGKAMDAFKKGVIEPLKIKTQAVKSASEVAVMILRIDDVIAGSAGGGGAPQGMPPPGMGGMPPGGMY